MPPHTRPIFTLCTLVALLALLGGCGAKVPSGMAGARVLVRAEPKAGYRPELQPSGGGYDSNPTTDDPGPQLFPFQVLNYSSLDEIVVWLEPQGGAPGAGPAPKPVTIDAGAGTSVIDKALKASAVGGEVRLENRSSGPVSAYLRSEQGDVTDAGTIAPGGSTAVKLPAAGLWLVLREADPSAAAADDVVVGEVYAAPTGWVQTTVSGGNVTFSPLPPGRYVARSWHPRLPGSSRDVTLAPDRVTDVPLVVSVNALPKVP
jgi:hypothetical protein